MCVKSSWVLIWLKNKSEILLDLRRPTHNDQFPHISAYVHQHSCMHTLIHTNASGLHEAKQKVLLFNVAVRFFSFWLFFSCLFPYLPWDYFYICCSLPDSPPFSPCFSFPTLSLISCSLFQSWVAPKLMCVLCVCQCGTLKTVSTLCSYIPLYTAAHMHWQRCKHACNISCRQTLISRNITSTDRWRE